MSKDARLDKLARHRNIAQFVSFSPETALRYCRVLGDPPLAGREIETLVSRAGSVNIRSFMPGREKGCPFFFGLTDAAEVRKLVGKLAKEGYYTIVIETIDTHDGGVSGVSLGGIAEFAPDSTPRTVEEPGAAALPLALAEEVLRTVYGVKPRLRPARGERLEFSVHPRRVGLHSSNTVWWEVERVPEVSLQARVVWPNKFSRHIGDKAFGLLVAHAIGLSVPMTTVIGRRVAPFSFGRATGSHEWWLRTCPAEQVPGKFSTVAAWTDPFALLANEDPSNAQVMSVLSQEGIPAAWSGATLPVSGARNLIEGVAGGGEAFMLGDSGPEELPAGVLFDVQELVNAAEQAIGRVRLEWVHDGANAWVVQMHAAVGEDLGPRVLSPGEAAAWVDFDASDGLEALRGMLPGVLDQHAGVIVHGGVGITSHVGDLLRKAGVPARFSSS